MERKNDRFLPKYTIGVTVRLTSIEPHRIRKYERYKLVRPARTESGQRLYCDADLDRLKEIYQLEEQGVNMQGIKLILKERRESQGAVLSKTTIK